VQKDTDDLTVFFLLLRSLGVKAAQTYVGEINPSSRSYKTFFFANKEFFLLLFLS